MRTREKTLALILLLLLHLPAFAEEVKESGDKPGDPELAKKVERNESFIGKLTKTKYLNLGAEFHGNLNMNTTDDGNDVTEAAFEVTRMYLTLKSTITDWLETRTTLDFDRLPSDEEQPLFGYIKYAYFDVKPVSGLKLRFGQQSRAWIGMLDDMFGYRWVMKSPTDQLKYMSSADLGFSVIGEYFDGLLGFQLGALNGVGYKAPAPAEGVESFLYEARVSLKPLVNRGEYISGLGLHLVAATDETLAETDDVRTNEFGGGVTYMSKYADLIFETISRSKDSTDYKRELLYAPSIALKYAGFALFGRYAVAMNENDTDKNVWSHLVAGLSYRPMEFFAVALDYQEEMNKKWAESEDKRIFLNTLFKF
ncbi:MAG: hypothetical protein Kow0090_16500 [Myxococcota bacterium]